MRWMKSEFESPKLDDVVQLARMLIIVGPHRLNNQDVLGALIALLSFRLKTSLLSF